jgi:glutathione S-transferase
MYKLFYAPDSASMGIRTILEEIGVPYELLASSIEASTPRPAEQLAINPNGWIPVLTWDGGSMYEAAAITLFLCDRHPQANLAPSPDAPERPLFLQTLVYFSSSVQNAFQLTYYPDRFVDSAEDEPSAQRRGNRRLTETFTVVDKQIGDNPWVLGKTFSAVDIYLYMLTTWINDELGHPSMDGFTNVKRIADQAAQRPSVQRVYDL